MVIVLVSFGVYFSAQTPLNDITKAYLERACTSTNGGFTSTDIQNLKNDLGKNGFDPSQLTITVTPSSAMNITSTSYAPRGTIINLSIVYNKQTMLDGLFKHLGSTNSTNNQCSRYGMSERP